jgi:hypothetical protein
MRHIAKACSVLSLMVTIAVTSAAEREQVRMVINRTANRGKQFRGDFQKHYDEGIQVALKYLGE